VPEPPAAPPSWSAGLLHSCTALLAQHGYLAFAPRPARFVLSMAPHGRYVAPLLLTYCISLDKTNVIHFFFIALAVLLLAVQGHSAPLWLALAVYAQVVLVASYLAALLFTCPSPTCDKWRWGIGLPRPIHWQDSQWDRSLRLWQG
jgi:hypothetical protein